MRMSGPAEMHSGRRSTTELECMIRQIGNADDVEDARVHRLHLEKHLGNGSQEVAPHPTSPSRCFGNALRIPARRETCNMHRHYFHYRWATRLARLADDHPSTKLRLFCLPSKRSMKLALRLSLADLSPPSSTSRSSSFTEPSTMVLVGGFGGASSGNPDCLAYMAWNCSRLSLASGLMHRSAR